MTKYEWERQLKKGISGLPKAEQQRVLDYYNELFADKIDAGLREQYIISEFGNPYDVANKILVDYYNEGKDNPEADAYIYSSSDEIDDAFDDGPAPATVAAPQRKTWSERREEKREARISEHNERAYHHDANDDAAPASQNSKKGARSAGGLIAVIAVLLYFVLGACFNMWHPAWLIFLIIPCVITLIEAINKHNWKIFAYPVFVTFLFLLIGFMTHRWHPTWILFITIPVYYVLGDFITKNTNGNVERRSKERQTKTVEVSVKSDEQASAKKVSVRVESDNTTDTGKGGFSRAVSIIAKILLALCLVWVAIAVWWCVIGLFLGGIGMIVGGIGTIVGAVVAGSSINMLLLGTGIALIGLGLICAFGMAALFKPCFNMCRSFVKTIKNNFDNKEVAK